jgi:hypothetical protein
VSAAEDVIHAKTILIEDAASPMFIRLLGSWMNSEATRWKRISTSVYHASDDPAVEVATIASVLTGAENFWIAKPMCDLAQHASVAMPDEELLAHDLPSQTGWMVLAEPFRLVDIRRTLICVNALSWAVRGDRVRVWSWVDKNNMHDMTNHTLREELGDLWAEVPMLTINHVFDLDFGRVLPRAVSWDTPLEPDAKVEISEVQNSDGSWALTFSTDQSIDITEEARVIRSPFAAYIVCIWRLCQQSIASRNPEEVGRTMRRKLGRMAIPNKPVSIITLRRIDGAYDPDGEKHVEWQHRWWCRGHWRNQPYREMNEDGEKVTIYRQIYIDPFIKGPADKPLLVRPKVNALVR